MGEKKYKKKIISFKNFFFLLFTDYGVTDKAKELLKVIDKDFICISRDAKIEIQTNLNQPLFLVPSTAQAHFLR